MIVVRDFDRLKGKELVATIGFFDGVLFMKKKILSQR